MRLVWQIGLHPGKSSLFINQIFFIGVELSPSFSLERRNIKTIYQPNVKTSLNIFTWIFNYSVNINGSNRINCLRILVAATQFSKREWMQFLVMNENAIRMVENVVDTKMHGKLSCFGNLEKPSFKYSFNSLLHIYLHFNNATAYKIR